MEDHAYVSFEKRDQIGIITFFHPKSNSLPSDILQILATEIEEAGNNSEINTIVLQSEGEKTFCAGASFDELLQIKDFWEGKKFFMGFANVINAMRKAPKFIITRIQGKAVGGGVGIAAASDYVLAHKDSSVKLSEYALGLGPNVVGPAVERKIGTAAFSQMSMDFEWYSSDWALNKGLYARVFNSIEELDNAVDKLADKFSKASPDAARELKKIFWEGTENWDQVLESRAEISGRLVLSDFTKNYIRQFKDK